MNFLNLLKDAIAVLSLFALVYIGLHAAAIFGG